MRQSVSIVVDSRDRRGPLEGLVRSREDAFLDPPGCPVCAYCVEAEDQFFRWFEIESFADPAMHARLRRSAGFCARHERRAIRMRQLAPIPPVVRGALEQLASEPPERDECPACESLRQAREHAEGLLAAVVASPSLRQRYMDRERAACLPHVRAMIAGGEPEPARLLAERLRRDLALGEGLQIVAGQDPDAAARGVWRAALPAAPPVDAATSAEAERAAWQLEACPVCHAGGRAERRYLDWRRHEERADAVDLQQEPGVLCAAHLHDLAVADPHAGERAGNGARERWLHELAATLKQWPQSTPGRRRFRRRGHGGARRRFEVPFCPACRARDGAEERHLDLVTRLLAQPPYAEAYDAAHGACVRHARLAGDSAAARHMRAAVRARLDVVAWEIAEAARKQGWDARHERPGPEQTARLRLSALVDGATFLGGPARQLP
jgi:hypothetical protein